MAGCRKTPPRLYDFQVETLFAGTADAMRRQALVPLYHMLKGKNQRHLKLLDVACGTGRFLREVKENYPRLHVTGLDLSAEYLREVRHALSPWRDVDTIHANAEDMPVPDEAVDVVTCIYLFHELPSAVRTRVAKEMARVLKPNGSLIFVDSLQKGDVADFDGLLERFPLGFHEPYYASYTTTDLTDLFAQAGLAQTRQDLAFMSKVLTFEKS